MENLEPKREKRSPISSLKFQRKSDYKKFRKFIKKETKELKGIVEPKQDKLKSILNVGVAGLGLFTIGGVMAAIKGRDDDTSGKFKTPFIVGKRNPSDSPDLPNVSITGIKPGGEAFAGQKSKLPFKTPVKQYKKTSKPIKTTVKNPKTKVTTPQKVKVGANVNQGKQGPTGGTGGRPTSGKSKSSLPFEYGTFNYSKNKPKVTTPQKVKVPEIFMDVDGTMVDSYDKLSVQGKKAGMIRKQLDDPNRKLTRSKRQRLIQELDRLEGKILPTTTVKPNIFNRFMNFYNKGRTSAEDTMKFFGKDGLIADDFSKITRTDKAFKEGAKGLKGARPFKAFTPNMLKTGPTPLTRQLIERPFRFLKNSPVVSSLLKSKVTKTGFIVLDLIFAGQAFADLFKPKDNLRTSVVDLYNAINNQIYKDDPSKLKYYITESSDDRIRAYHIQKNKEIRLLKEKAGLNLSGSPNVLIVPENKQNNEVKSNIPIKTGGTKVSFVPTEPLNSVGTDILLHKLNQ